MLGKISKLQAADIFSTRTTSREHYRQLMDGQIYEVMALEIRAAAGCDLLKFRARLNIWCYRHGLSLRSRIRGDVLYVQAVQKA